MVRILYVLSLLFEIFSACSSPSQPPDSTWVTKKFGNFIFHYQSDEKKLARYLGDRCTKIESRIAMDLGLEELGDIQVIIVSTHEDFVSAQPTEKKAKKWAAALAYPGQRKIIMKSPKLLLGGQPDYEKIFIHEIAHIALDRAMDKAITKDATAATGQKAALPLWLHEGYAIYLAGEWSPSREVMLTQAVLRKKLIPLGRLVQNFPNDESQARLAYAISADLIHFLISTYGHEAFHQFISSLGQGNRFGHASREVFGLDLIELEENWQKHLKTRYTWIPLLTSTGTLWFLTSVVFLVAYIYKKVTTRQKLAEWSEKEVDL